MNRKSKIRLCLFGFDRQQVDKSIEKIRENNQERIDEIKDRIQALRDENEKMIKEIELLKEESRVNLQPEEFMKFSLEKYEEWAHLINSAAYNNTSEITLMMEKQEEIFNRKIKEFDETIKNTEEQLDNILRSILEKNESFSEKFKIFIKQKLFQDGDKTEINYEIPNEYIPEEVSNIQVQGEINQDNTKIKDIITPREFFESDIDEYISQS